MERALDPELLGLALGEHADLPSPVEVSELLARAEMAILLHRPETPSDLIAIGWYLHGIASSKHALRLYGVERHRAAFQVAGHIFDLLLKTPELGWIDRLKYCFAAQVAYLRSTLNPNSLALYRREFAGKLNRLSLLSDSQQLALSCGVAFLGFDVAFIFEATGSIRREVLALERAWDIPVIPSTPIGSAAGAALATRDLMSFLVYGSADALERARERLQTAVRAENSEEDQISRWIAGHLLNLVDDLNNSSVWTALPPDIPLGVRRAFAMGHPRVLTLWPPQLDLFNIGGQNQTNPLSPQIRRLFLSTPTSGGKTLLAQLLIMAHMATERTGVCYVAPTRSLCWEIRQSLESRLRFLGKEIVAGLPEGGWLDSLLIDFEPEVEVMTPERLSYLMRTDSQRLLDQFGMFIFDEVHTVGEPERGWTLEEDLIYIHFATENTSHRIVLMSAAVGNRNQIVQWMSATGDQVLYHHSPWRGPRRLHAIWRTNPDWDKSVSETTRSTAYPFRVRYPLHGVLHTRISHTGRVRSVQTEDPIGELVLKVDRDGSRTKDRDLSTPFYKMLVPIILHLSEAGPVLIIESTRPQTVRLAKAIADSLDLTEEPGIQSLVDLVRARLGVQHPLWSVLRKGVAYHHGSLPDEIRASIEAAVSDGYLRLLVATTTLTEGVNLPVQSVVVASQGSHGAGGYAEYITGSKLINAIGRAGRATKETEGVVVLARDAPPDPGDFERLDPKDSDIEVRSTLATEKALERLADFEALQRLTEDAVFQTATGEVADFLSFVWFIAAELERLGQRPTQQRIENVLDHSLAWVQLNPENKERWLAAAALALIRYENTDRPTRRRWAVAGTAISSASEIERIARDLVSILGNFDAPQDPLDVAQLIVGDGRLDRILRLPEAPKRRVYTHRGGQSRREITVEVDLLLRDWLLGISLVDLADAYFAGVEDIDFRFEQLGDFIYDYFEVFFPWVFGTIIAWTNSLLEESNSELLPRAIPANVRWGVGNPVALDLMVRGVQSRSLALRIASAWQSEEREADVHTWIRSMNIADWQQAFDASPTELRTIADFSRVRRGGVAVQLITHGTAQLEVDSYVADWDQSSALLVPIDGSALSAIEIWVGEERVGRVRSRDQTDVRSLLGTGLILSVTFLAQLGHAVLDLVLVDPEA